MKKKPIGKRIAGNELLEFTPNENTPEDSDFAKAFRSINSDEPMDLQSFLLELNAQINKQANSNHDCPGHS